MVKSPLEYFEAQDFTPLVIAEASGDAKVFSETEQTFMLKYLGVDSAAGTGGPVELSVASVAPSAQSLPMLEPSRGVRGDGSGAISEETALQQLETVQFVGFYVGDQLYAMPTLLVQEVIPQMPCCQLPSSSPYVNGVINLRGQVTALVKLRDMLSAGLPSAGICDRFTIVCKSKGVQIGVQIDRVHSMYRINRHEIQWNLDASLGLAGECITGFFELNEKLVPIISVERVMGQLLPLRG